MSSASASGEAATSSASQDGYVRAVPMLKPACRRNADQPDRVALGQSVELAADNGERLVDRVDAGQVDNLAADNHEDIRIDDAVAIVDRGILPQPAKVAEAGSCRGRAHHAVAALHPDDAVKIDRPN